MKPLSPLTASASTDAERVIAAASAVRPRALDAAAWDGVLARAQRPRAWPRLVVAFALSLALGVVSVLVLRPAPSPVAALPSVELVATAGALWTKAPSGEVSLQSGQLAVRAPAGVTVRVVTPQVAFEAQGSRFLAEVLAHGTTLLVEEGEVTMRAGDTVRVVRAGERLEWPPTPSIPGALLAEVPTPETRCAPGPERRNCLTAETLADTLDAQAALYELGLVELEAGRVDDAVTAWRASLSRFPAGVLHPEVRLRLLVTLVRARRFEEASGVAEAFELECSDDARLGDVRALRGALKR